MHSKSLVLALPGTFSKLLLFSKKTLVSAQIEIVSARVQMIELYSHMDKKLKASSRHENHCYAIIDIVCFQNLIRLLLNKYELMVFGKTLMEKQYNAREKHC